MSEGQIESHQCYQQIDLKFRFYYLNLFWIYFGFRYLNIGF